MSATIVTMAPAVEHIATPFHRSHSTSELATLNEPGFAASRGLGSKSLPHIPSFDVPSFDPDFELDTTEFSASPSLSSTANRPTTSAGPEAPRAAAPPPRRSLSRARTDSAVERPRSWFVVSKPLREPSNEEPSPRPTTSFGENGSGRWTSKFSDLRAFDKGHVVSGAFSNLAKRPWMSTSRPSFTKNRSAPTAKESPEIENEAEDEAVPALADKRSVSISVLPENQRRSSDSLGKPSPNAFTRASSYLDRMRPRPSAARAKFVSGNESDNSCTSSAASVAPPASNSAETRSSGSTCRDSHTTRTEDSSDVPPKHRDPLWLSFKALETDFKTLLPKQTGPRVAQIQNTLLPFLRQAADFRSLDGLEPEDIELRTTILDEWWVAALDILEGQPGQMPLAGVDMPCLLEVATFIMMRPEWRELTVQARPLGRRTAAERAQRADSARVTDDSASDSTMADAAEHNVRTAYGATLTRQMAFIVSKMTRREVPLCMAAFAGKAAAYAFFFAPGVGDILVRLWPLNLEIVRRAANELGLGRRYQERKNGIAALFPTNLRDLTWHSPKRAVDGLKRTPQMSILLSHIPWAGPWVHRWKGRDTSMFYVFCKHFHHLADQFLPSGLPLAERATSPAFVLVQAQILWNLDSTIHRQMGGGFFGVASSSPYGSDATALAMSLPPPHATRAMSDNPLVVLLRDVIDDDTLAYLGARHTFTEAFASMLRAATSHTSQFNNLATFTLCDLLEEVLPILSAHDDRDLSPLYVDWDFWLTVWEKMLSSLSTMSEIRVLSFVYTVWEMLTQDPHRKEKLCLGWLLREDTFATFFYHWCPMVRAYYHRLLCWRICRDEGRTNESDMNIFVTATNRLETVWAHYVYLKESAEEAGRLPPPSAPVQPSPGKKFTITWHETATVQPTIFSDFDQLLRKHHQIGDGTPSDGPSAENSMGKSDGRKRWSFFDKMLSFTSAGAAQGPKNGGHGRSQSWDDELHEARRETAESRTRTTAPDPPPKINTSATSTAPDPFDASPLFEPPKQIFRFFLGFDPATALGPPLARAVTRPRLPAPAQSRVSTRARRTSSSPPAPSTPADTRTFSGSLQQGLVHGAKNAAAEKTPIYEPVQPLSLHVPELGGEFVDVVRSGPETEDFWAADEALGARVEYWEKRDSPESTAETTFKPVKPTGISAKNGAYSGRALVEWSTVVAECNVFLERRRSEGVLGLSEIEVPLLGTEGFRKLAG